MKALARLSVITLLCYTISIMQEKNRGFTIVELLIVIVVIAILAAISVVAYNGIQDRAKMSKAQGDLRNLQQAMVSARIHSGGVLQTVTLSWATGGACAGKPNGTDLSNESVVPKTDSCWVNYTNALDRISTASGQNVRNLVDPWGRPYVIDENENESGPTYCAKDYIGVYQIPLAGWTRMANTSISLPNVAPACT